MPHQQTLRASIDWSYDLLSAAERTLLRRLAVFAGGCTLEAAEAVCSDGEVQVAHSVMELLANLVEKSLVTLDAGGERYHLLETVREYAREQLEESGEAAEVRDRHLQHFLAFASRARLELVGPAQATWYRNVDLERDNLMAAQQWCGEAGQPLLGLRLISSLKGYWVNRGLVAFARGIMIAALESVPERGRQRARTLYDAGQMGYFMGLFVEARAQLEECLGIAREIGDKVLIGLALQPLGLACAGAGDPSAARPYLEEAIEPRARAGGAASRGRGGDRARAAASRGRRHRIRRALVRARGLPRPRPQRSDGRRDRAAQPCDGRGRPQEGRTRARRARRGARYRALDRFQAPGPERAGSVRGLAASLEDWQRAASFYGAAEAEASRTGIRRDPADEAFLAPHIERARASAGAEAVRRAREPGTRSRLRPGPGRGRVLAAGVAGHWLTTVGSSVHLPVSFLSVTSYLNTAGFSFLCLILTTVPPPAVSRSKALPARPMTIPLASNSQPGDTMVQVISTDCLGATTIGSGATLMPLPQPAAMVITTSHFWGVQLGASAAAAGWDANSADTAMKGASFFMLFSLLVGISRAGTSPP
jgi:non-specific serine/threonine protein kinase